MRIMKIRYLFTYLVILHRKLITPLLFASTIKNGQLIIGIAISRLAILFDEFPVAWQLCDSFGDGAA